LKLKRVSRLQVGSRWFNVTWSRTPPKGTGKHVTNTTYGATNVYKSRIWINTSYPPDVQLCTLIHEAFHGREWTATIHTIGEVSSIVENEVIQHARIDDFADIAAQVVQQVL